MVFNALSRNKRSIALNLKTEEARNVFYRLTQKSDVVLEGFRPGVVKRLGVDYETLSRINPRLVYCSLSGYGQDGPYVGLVGHDINYIAIGGALGMIGWLAGRRRSLNILGDFAGGACTLHSASGAIIARERTGRGQYVDMAATERRHLLLAGVISQHFAWFRPSRGRASERRRSLLPRV
jgi:alpha-methylacyl-CoA racemase